jgi:hypothetical protein
VDYGSAFLRTLRHEPSLELRVPREGVAMGDVHQLKCEGVTDGLD